MWDFAGEPIPTEAMDAIHRFLTDGPPSELLYLLDSFEGDAMVTRARALLEAGIFPDDDSGGHRYPWPLV